ncbi:MAG: TonB-dependent receptor [Flavobacteriales bacterium]|nr:TonB-dependent receptor [Flavobacteriales bacterium]
MKNLVLLVIIIMANTVLMAQQIKGRVIDSQTKKSIPGVNIYLPEIKKGVVSEVNGDYTLNLPRKGTYKIQVSFIGYAILLKTVAINQDTILNFELTEAVIETKEFVISSVYHSSQDENPVEVIQFDSKQLEQSTSPTLMQSLTNVAGVNMVSTGTGIGKPVIRGLSYNRVLIFSQGIPIDNQQFGDEHGLGLSEIGIDKVEIIKGPSSLLYGADAMGGVLHFVEERPASINTIVGDFGTKYFSNTNGYQSTLGIKGATENFRYKIRGGRSSHGDYKQGGNGSRVTNTRYTASALKVGVGFMKKWWTNDVNYSFLQSAIGIPEELGVQNTSRKLLEPFQVITNHIVSTQNTFHIKKSHIKLNLGYLTNIRKEFEGGNLSESFYHSNLDSAVLDMLLQTTNYDIKWHLPEFKHIEIIIGSQGKYQTNENRGEESLISDANISQLGGFTMIKYSKKKFSTITGIRFDAKTIDGKKTGKFGEEGYKRAFKQHYESVNGSLGLTYKWTDKYLTRINVASGFRTPNLAELSSNGVHEGTIRYEIGKLDLSTEQNIEIDFGIEYVNKHISFAFSAFNNAIANYIFLVPTDSIIDNHQVYTYTQNDANLYGFETTLDIHPHAMHWLHFETQFAMVIGKKSDGISLPQIPANNLLNTLKAEIKDFKLIKKPFISVAVNTIFGQNNVDVFESSTSSYLLLNAKIGGNVIIGKQRILLSIGITNLLDKEYYSHLSRLKTDNIYNMGRNIVVNLKVPFGIKK